MYIVGAAGFIVQALIGLAIAIPILMGVYGGKFKKWLKRPRTKTTTQVASETQQED